MSNHDRIKLPWPDWEIVRKLGRGGFGSVYEIHRTVLGHTERSALKIICIPADEDALEADYAEGYDNAALAERYRLELESLMKEYRFMYAFRGESTIVNCEDIGTMQQDNGIGWNLYIRMELLQPLISRLKATALSEHEILQLGIDICQALVLCEQKNVIHRDIKPENIMISKMGRYKLGDFGIARTMDHATHATRVGTIRYMAPEVIRGEKYGFSVDVYSLGLVMYWLLNHRRMPFLPTDRIPTPEEITAAQDKRVQGQKLPAPLNGSSELHDIILHACAFFPEDRYGSAQEMLLALTNLLHQNGNQLQDAEQKAPSTLSTDGTTETVMDSAQKILEHTEENNNRPLDQTAPPDGVLSPQDKTGKSRRRIWILLGICVTALLAIIGLSLANKQAGDTTPEISEQKPGLIPAEEEDPVEWSSTEDVQVKKETESAEASSESEELSPDEVKPLEYTMEPEIGEVYSFGCYEQDNDLSNGAEDILWEVLDKADGQVMLISKYILDDKAYNHEITYVTWEDCSLRSWLNDDFLYEAFDLLERDRLITVDVPADANANYDTTPGNMTQDTIFLLSTAEAENYFDTAESRACQMTPYAAAKGFIDNDNGIWWLRTPGIDSMKATHVTYNGAIDYPGESVANAHIGLRPVIWVTVKNPDEYAPDPAFDSADVAKLENGIDPEIGASYLFGNFEQDNDRSNGTESIEWIVLDKKDGQALLISKYALDARAYYSEAQAVTWENSDIRAWLNSSFMESAFRPEDIDRIATVEITTPANQRYDIDGGNPTQDQLFLLSKEEAEAYFPTREVRLCQPTPYASREQEPYEMNGYCSWWLRTPGDEERYATYVGAVGDIYDFGAGVHRQDTWVRPAMWIKL